MIKWLNLYTKTKKKDYRKGSTRKFLFDEQNYRLSILELHEQLKYYYSKLI